MPRLLAALSLVALAALLAPAAQAGDDDFLAENDDPAKTRHTWTWPLRAHFNPAAAEVVLNWAEGTGTPEERLHIDDVVRLERARPFESQPDELFMLLADGRRVLVARGPDIGAQSSITAAVADLPVKELPPGEGHFAGSGARAPTVVVVGGGGGIEVRPVARTEIASAPRPAATGLALSDVEDDPRLRGEGGGTLEKYAIDLVMKQKTPVVRQCYTRELRRDPSLRGKLVVRFVVGESGRVKYAAVRGSTLDSRIVEECVLEKIRTAEFPKPRGGTVIVSYPFSFSGG